MNTRCSLLLLIGFLFNYTTVIAQNPQPPVENGVELSKFVPSSPEAAALGKYGQSSLNLYTGTPNISIPLYEIQSGDVSLPISLSYSSSGSKVEELPSRVGLGWTLNGGGVVTRTVRGRPDDRIYGYIDGNHNASSLNSKDLNSTDGMLMAYEACRNNIDVEPDMFYFNITGASGKFFLDEDGGVHTMPEQKIKIEYQFTGSQYTREITSFTITSISGVKYYFGGNTEQGNKAYEDVNMPEFYDNFHDFKVKTAWYLLKVVSPLNEVVKFDYYNRDFDVINYTTVNKYHFYDLSVTGCNYMVIWNQIDPPSKVPQDHVNSKINHLNATSLKSIQFSNGKVYFTEGVTQRNDQPGLYPLVGLNVENNEGSIVKNFNFSYNYNNNRLALEKVTEGGLLDAKEYKLNYIETPSGLPTDRNSFSKDHWGYFNGKTNNTLVPPIIHSFPKQHPNVTGQFQDVYLPGADRYPDVNSCKIGVLNKIQYPTGGITELEYELNTESNYKHEYSIQQTQYFLTTGSLFTNQNINGVSTDVYSQPVSFYNAMGKKLKISVQALNLGNAVGELWQKDVNGNFTIFFQNISNRTTAILPPSGEYQLRVSNVVGSPAYSIRFDWINDTDIFYGGGLRVSKITNTDPFAPTKPEIKKYDYTEANLSSGYMQGLFNYSYDMEDAYDPCYSVLYLIRTATSNIPLVLPEGCTIGYSKVTEIYGNNAEGGKKEYFFTTTKDYSDLQYLQFPFASEENMEFLRGRQRAEKIYKKGSTGFDLVSESQSLINIEHFTNTPTSKIGFNPRITGTFLRRNDLGLIRQPGKTKTAKFYVSESKSIEYDPNQPILSLENKKQTISLSPTTDLPNHTVVFNSKTGEEIHQYITYVKDIPASVNTSHPYIVDSRAFAGLAQLTNKEKINLPAEIITVKKMSNGDMFVIDATLNIYHPMVPELSTVYKLEMLTPRPFNDFLPCYLFPIAGTGGAMELHMDQNYKKKIIINGMDNKGNILEQKKFNDVSMMYIWDYDKSYPTAEAIFPQSHMPNQQAYGEAVINPVYYSPWIAHTSFETADGGNWTGLDPTRIQDPTPLGFNAVTGSKAYSLAANDLFTFNHLIPTETYYVTAWYRSFPPTINTNVQGASYTPQAITTRNGWTLYRCEISGATSVTLSGKGFIDELRVYPKYGRMTTYTYKPLVGVTTICDENNNVSYYEYDNLNRVKQIKDKDGNILKVFDYKYQQ